MQGLIEFPDSPELYHAPCEVGLGTFNPFIDKEEAKSVIISCYNPQRQNIITCRDEFRDEFIKEVGGLPLNLKLTSEVENIPSYIPIVDYGMRDIPLNMPVVGLTLHDIISRGVKSAAGMLHEQDDIRFRSSMLSSKALVDKKVILFLTGADTLIEWVWYNRNDCRIFEILKQMGFWGVGGFNFSVIGGECAFAQALNQKRSLFSASLIEKNGLLAIPHVYALSQFHIDRWVKWFIANPVIKMFTVNCQLQKSQKDIAQVISVVKSILWKVPYLHVILQGFHVNIAHQFGTYLERIHFADKMPIKQASSHQKVLIDYTKNKLYHELAENENIETLALTNINKRYTYIENLRSAALQKKMSIQKRF
jgi:hypothetical protein